MNCAYWGASYSKIFLIRNYKTTKVQNWKKRLTTTRWSNQSGALVIMWPEVWSRSGHRSRKDSGSSCQRVRTVCFETDRLEEALLTDFYMCAQVLLLKEQTRRSCWLIWRRSWSRADSWSERSSSYCRSGTRAALTSDLLFRTVSGSDLSQDSVTAPLPAVLMDCYYLEEWERLQDHWEEFNRQRRSFQQERQAFTEAAIRLGHEVREMHADFMCARVFLALDHLFLHVFLRFLMMHEVSSTHWGPGPKRGPQNSLK